MSETFHSIDPASGEVVWQGAAASRGEVEQAVAAARTAFPDWASRPIEQRIAFVRSFAEAIKRREGELASMIARETGKPLWEARAEVGSIIAKVDVSIAAHAERTGERCFDTAFGRAVLRHRPHGVMAVLGPFNFPGHLPNGHLVPALLAGNCAVFKPSELTPGTGEVYAAAWADAHLPPGVLTVVQGGRETGAALVDADIDGLLFTGSARAGAHFRSLFADRPNVILALELGGNNPLVVWDGDLAGAAAIAVQSAYLTTGQRCSCARRLIVPDSALGSQAVEAIADLSDRLVIGRWDDRPEPFMGPLVSAVAAAGAHRQVARLIDLGAKVIRPLTRIAGHSAAFVTPALLDVTGLDAPDEEIFAPVLQVTRVPDFREAITAANRTRFGLSAGLVTEDDGLWQQFVAHARAGVVNRNRPTTGALGTMPFGGLGESGNHRPSAYYAADYCAYPIASVEAATTRGDDDAIAGRLTP
jgi:succinylglutamic semialdehyde dehydrogenase